MKKNETLPQIKVVDVKNANDLVHLDLDCEDEAFERMVELGQDNATEDDYFKIGMDHFFKELANENP